MARYKKGQSGNPKGRPIGVKDKRTELRQLLKPHTQKLVKKTVDLALDGDTTALRLCLERLIPTIKQKDEYIKFKLTGNTQTEQSKSIIIAMSNGEITPTDTNTILQTMATQCRIAEMDEFEERLRKLEDRIN